MSWLAAPLFLQTGRGCNLNLKILIFSTAAAQFIQLMHIYYLNFAATRQLFLNMLGNQGEDGEFLFQDS